MLFRRLCFRTSLSPDNRTSGEKQVQSASNVDKMLWRLAPLSRKIRFSIRQPADLKTVCQLTFKQLTQLSTNRIAMFPKFGKNCEKPLFFNKFVKFYWQHFCITKVYYFGNDNTYFSKNESIVHYFIKEYAKP